MKRYSGVLVRHNNKVLLAKRNHKGALPGEWSIFGGSIEENENPINGAVREFFEETNCKAENPLELCGVIDRYTRDGKKLKGMMYVFLMDVDKVISPDLASAHDGDEHSTWGYFSKNELPSPLGDKLKDLINLVLK